MTRDLACPVMMTLFAATLVACGGSVSPDPSLAGDDAGADAEPDTRHHHDSGVDAPIDTGHDAIIVHDSYVDPGCGDATPPPILKYDCDPFATPTKCPSGEACYPYVMHAPEPCAPETYGATCYAAGSGAQGTPCSSENECKSGFVCVVTNSGNVCAALCKVGVPGACAEGLVCGPTDIPGYGVCL